MNSPLLSNKSGLRPLAFSRASRRAFTLIEILVVVMLITLLSGLAVFNMMYLRESTMRKAAVADCRTVAAAIAAFQIDHSFIPKIGFLSYQKDELHKMAGNTPGVPFILPNDFDAIGYYSSASTPALALRSQQATVMEEWAGPYLPSARQRKLISSSGGKGYFTRMLLPGGSNAYGSPPSGHVATLFTNVPAAGAETTIPAPGVAIAAADYAILDWPADPWGNPYVLYLVHVDAAAGSSPRWILSPSESTNFAAYVVSYGKNGFPGGDSTIPEQDGLDGSPVKVAALPYRLYEESSKKLYFDFVALKPHVSTPLEMPQVRTAGEYDLPRLQALHNNAGWMAAGFPSPPSVTYTLPNSNPNGWAYLGPAYPLVPGILDKGSDDITYQIP